MTVPSLIFSPILPPWVLALALVLAASLAVLGWFRGGAGGLAWHLLPALAVVAALANPRLTTEDSVTLDDVAVLLVDESPSMEVGDRKEQVEKAVAAITERLGRLDRLQIKVLRHRNAPGLDEGTRLFSTLEAGLADVPRGRLAGVLAITDGEIADVPTKAEIGAPLHVLLAGHKDERDRRVVIERPPSFALVGKTAVIAFKVEDPGHDEPVTVVWRKDGGETRTMRVPANSLQRIEVAIDHAGSNVIEIEAEMAPGELTAANNRTAIAIAGVRDRLRVLLISGEPHAGERTWRNLLKADPSVDLVHFTILRPPNVADGTPLRELALIAFPTKELFEDRLRGFDLVILDRYRLRSVLPPAYFKNLADYVRSGGALLMAVGSEFAQSDSPFATALAEVMPVLPDGTVDERAFKPRVSAMGKRHPVTASLPGGSAEPPAWGPWARQVGATVRRGQAVLEGNGGRPLLVLDHVEKGRVAELLSDSAWLWGRGWQGGGPQAELLRRLAHWLMKEPELEEERLSADIRDGRLVVERTSLSPAEVKVKVLAPDGEERVLALADQGDGRALVSTPADQQGLWRVEDGVHVAMAAMGALNPVEMANLRATPDKVRALAEAAGGGVRWLDDGIPETRRVRPKALAAGSSWIGLRANDDKMTISLRDSALMSPIALLLLGLGGLVWAWWRQGR